MSTGGPIAIGAEGQFRGFAVFPTIPGSADLFPGYRAGIPGLCAGITHHK
jgi:hypothetical protein